MLAALIVSNPRRIAALVRRQPPPTAQWLGTSHADTFSYPATAAVIARAKQPLSASATVMRNAGHSTAVWLDLLLSALDWLGRSLPGCAHRSRAMTGVHLSRRLDAGLPRRPARRPPGTPPSSRGTAGDPSARNLGGVAAGD